MTSTCKTIPKICRLSLFSTSIQFSSRWANSNWHWRGSVVSLKISPNSSILLIFSKCSIDVWIQSKRNGWLLNPWVISTICCLFAPMSCAKGRSVLATTASKNSTTRKASRICWVLSICGKRPNSLTSKHYKSSRSRRRWIRFEDKSTNVICRTTNTNSSSPNKSKATLTKSMKLWTHLFILLQKSTTSWVLWLYLPSTTRLRCPIHHCGSSWVDIFNKLVGNLNCICTVTA